MKHYKNAAKLIAEYQARQGKSKKIKFRLTKIKRDLFIDYR